LQKLLQWRKGSSAVTEGKMIHYAPRGGIYVYARIKDNHTVLVILNSSLKEQNIRTDRFSDVTGSFTTGKDIITSNIFNITESFTIPAKGEYILELAN
jgi:hypothetical protein